MRGAADTRGISLKSNYLAARLQRLRSAPPPAWTSKLVTGALAAALAAAAVREGLDIRWAVGAAALATSAARKNSSAGPNESVGRSLTLGALVSAHLFGLAPAAAGRLKAAAARGDSTLVLTGTIATRDSSNGFALIGASAETAHVHPVGDSVASGVVLRAVYRDHVVVERSGQLSAVFFQRNGRAAAFAATPARSVASAGRRARKSADDADTEQSQRQRIDDAIETESERTAAFVRQEPFYSDGQLRGIVLQPGSDPGMLARLGLKAGDVLEWIDGLPIAQPDRLDWLRRRLQTGQTVALSVIRPGDGEVQVKVPAGTVSGMIEN